MILTSNFTRKKEKSTNQTEQNGNGYEGEEIGGTLMKK